MRALRNLFAGLAAFLFVASAAPAQKSSAHSVGTARTSSTRPPEDSLKSLLFVQDYAQVAVSPDGKRVAWVETQLDKKGDETGQSDIYVADVANRGKPLRVTAGDAGSHCNENGLAWSPDSQRLAFLSDAAKKGQLQVYVTNFAGTRKKITTAKGLLATPKYSPDGKLIAVLHTEDATREAGPLVAETAETGVIKDTFFEQRLAVVDATGGNLREVTPADIYIYEYDWTPDSKHVVMTAAKGNGDNDWYIAELYSADVASAEMKELYKPKLQIGRPVVSRDGKTIAFIEGLMSDEDSVGGDVFVIAREGGASRNLTPGRKASAHLLAWTRDGKLIDMEDIQGESSVIRIDPVSGSIDPLYRGAELLTNGFWATSLSLTPDGARTACVRTSYAAPPEVWAGAIGKWQQLTRKNSTLKPAWGQARSVHWKNGSFDVQGWLIYPKDFDASKNYPMVVDVHGGPGASVQPSWPSGWDYGMALPARGYFLFRPNPRGSFGQGEAFTQANVRDFGYGDWSDILTGVDAVLALAPVDPPRLGLTGWSYGGYMTMWGVTQTDRFRAAVAGAGIANLVSYYGENKIDQWMIPFFGASVYDDPDIYTRSAPLTFIKNVKTPTLILVGDSDGECPPPQSYEFWHALETLGVETELVVYEHEGHHFVKPEHLRDRIERVTEWFDKHLK